MARESRIWGHRTLNLVWKLALVLAMGKSQNNMHVKSIISPSLNMTVLALHHQTRADTKFGCHQKVLSISMVITLLQDHIRTI